MGIGGQGFGVLGGGGEGEVEGLIGGVGGVGEECEGGWVDFGSVGGGRGEKSGEVGY